MYLTVCFYTQYLIVFCKKILNVIYVFLFILLQMKLYLNKQVYYDCTYYDCYTHRKKFNSLFYCVLLTGTSVWPLGLALA